MCNYYSSRMHKGDLYNGCVTVLNIKLGCTTGVTLYTIFNKSIFMAQKLKVKLYTYKMSKNSLALSLNKPYPLSEVTLYVQKQYTLFIHIYPINTID